MTLSQDFGTPVTQRHAPHEAIGTNNVTKTKMKTENTI